MTHKLSTFVLRNPPEKAPVEDKKGAEKGAKARAPAQKRPQEAEGDVEWSVDTSPAAVEARRRELLGTRDRLTQRDDEEENSEASANPKDGVSLVFTPGQNPIPTLQKYLASNPDPQVCVQEVLEAATRVRWSDTQTMKVIFSAIMDADLKVNFYKKCDKLALFVKGSKHEKVVLYCLEKILDSEPKLLKDLANILNGFYEEAILSEDTIFKWYEHISKTTTSKNADPKEKETALRLKENVTPFVEWLKTAESDNEEDFWRKNISTG